MEERLPDHERLDLLDGKIKAILEILPIIVLMLARREARPREFAIGAATIVNDLLQVRVREMNEFDQVSLARVEAIEDIMVSISEKAGILPESRD